MQLADLVRTLFRDCEQPITLAEAGLICSTLNSVLVHFKVPLFAVGQYSKSKRQEGLDLRSPQPPACGQVGSLF